MSTPLEVVAIGGGESDGTAAESNQKVADRLMVASEKALKAAGGDNTPNAMSLWESPHLFCLHTVTTVEPTTCSFCYGAYAYNDDIASDGAPDESPHAFCCCRGARSYAGTRCLFCRAAHNTRSGRDALCPCRTLTYIVCCPFIVGHVCKGAVCKKGAVANKCCVPGVFYFYHNAYEVHKPTYKGELFPVPPVAVAGSPEVVEMAR